MSVLDGFKEVGERTGGKLTMTVMLESVRFSKGVSEVLGRPEFVKLLVNYERGKFAIQGQRLRCTSLCLCDFDRQS